MLTVTTRARLTEPEGRDATAPLLAHHSNDADDPLRTLYAERGHALLAFAERFTGDRGRAADIVQETFLRARRNLPRLVEDARPLRPWLLRVGRRLLTDAARAGRARPSLSDNGQAVDSGLDQLLDQTIIADALQRRSPAHQQIVIETYLLGTPMHLTVAKLGVPPPAQPVHDCITPRTTYADNWNPTASPPELPARPNTGDVMSKPETNEHVPTEQQLSLHQVNRNALRQSRS